MPAAQTERSVTPTASPAMLSGESAQAVQSAFGKLAESVLARAIGEQSIEDMTRELLKVMLKQWLDDNLPAVVERLVREEIERVARTGR
jgi:cell pole-organizing protein PopZ